MNSIDLVSPHHKQVTQAFAVDTVVRLGDVSSPDVYVTIVLKDRQYTLWHNDSMTIPAGTATLHLFRHTASLDDFSAKVILP